MTSGIEYVVVGLLGLLVGTGELVSRYRDEPGRAILTRPAYLYLFLNVAVAVLALVLIRGYKWDFGLKDPASLQITQVLVAGFSAMALFRSSLFTVRVGDTDVGIGPSSVLKVVLDAADRAVDRRRAAVRDVVVARLMANVSFDKAFQALPAHCFALMQSLPQSDQIAFGQQIKLIQAGQMTPRVKSMLLGLALLNLVGEDVLRSAVNSLGDDIR